MDNQCILRESKGQIKNKYAMEKAQGYQQNRIVKYNKQRISISHTHKKILFQCEKNLEEGGNVWCYKASYESDMKI